MYSVTADFLSAMNQPIQQHKISGTIGSASFGPVNILAGSFSINNKLCDTNAIGIGNVYIGELTATFRGLSINPGEWQGKVITPVFSLLTDPDTDTWEDVPLGVFTVQEATISASGVSVKAYDNMSKFDKPTAAGYKRALPWLILKSVCLKCGVEFANTRAEIAAMPNGSIEMNTFDTNDISTFRDVISWVGQTICANATITRDGALLMVPFKSTVDASYDDTHRHEGATFADYETTITEVSIKVKPTNTVYYYHVTPNDGLTYDLGQNPFLQLGSESDRETHVRAILNGLQAVNYTPFSVNLTGCPIYDLGDVLTFTDGILSGTKKGAITAYTYTYNGAYKLSCGGNNPAEANAKSKEDKLFDQIDKDISSEKNTMTVARNANAANIGGGYEVTVIDYPFEVVDDVNLTNVSTEIIMTTAATVTEVDDVISIGDLVARIVLYLDGVEIDDLYPEFIVSEGKDTINFDYALKNLGVGAHTYEVRVELTGGTGTVAARDAHEFLWGYGITFEVYVKSIQVTDVPKRSFRIGEGLDFTGLVVRGINNNGTTTDVSSDIATDPPAGTVYHELQVVEVDAIYTNEKGDDLEDSFDIQIVQVPFDGTFTWCYGGTYLYCKEDGITERVDYSWGGIYYPNDHEFIERGNSGVAFRGRDVESACSISGQIDNSNCMHGVDGGFLYWYDQGGKNFKFMRVYGDSELGKLGNDEEIGHASFSTMYFPRSLFMAQYTGDIVPILTDELVYGYVDLKAKQLVANWKDLQSLGMSRQGGKGQTFCHLPNGDSYFFIGNGVPKFMHTYIGGVHHWYDLSAIDDLAADTYAYFFYGMYYDAENQCLVLYICRRWGSSYYSMNYVTRCYKLALDGHTVIESVSVPAYLDIPADPNDTEIAYYEQAQTFRLWCNGNGINDQYPDTVDGVRGCTIDGILNYAGWGTSYNFGLILQWNDDGTPATPNFMAGSTCLVSVHNTAKRFIYIDNIYLQDSENNVVRSTP